MSYLFLWEVVFAHHLFDQSPFIQSVFSDLILASLAEVLNLGLIRIADVAEVLKVDIDDEICRDYLIFVLTNVLRTQLHLSGLDVVT